MSLAECMLYVWTEIAGRYERIRKGDARHGYDASVPMTSPMAQLINDRGRENDKHRLDFGP
jgi:hypothetical protein